MVTFADTSHAHDKLGYTPKIPLEEVYDDDDDDDDDVTSHTKMMMTMMQMTIMMPYPTPSWGTPPKHRRRGYSCFRKR